MAIPSASDFLALAKNRRTVRKFRDEPVDRDLLCRLVEAGQWAPSGSGREPCVFVVVDDPVQLARLRTVAPGIIGRPPAVVAVCVDDSRRAFGDADGIMPAMDAAMATQNILLCATTMGLGSGPVLSFDEKAVQSILQLPPHIRALLLIAIGYADGPVGVGHRRPLEEVQHWNRHTPTASNAAAGSATETTAPRPPINVENEASLGSPDMLHVLGFMLSAAKLLYREPKDYGPYRLLDAASRLAYALEQTRLGSATTRAVGEAIEREKYYGLNTQAEIAGLVDQILPLITGLVAR